MIDKVVRLTDDVSPKPAFTYEGGDTPRRRWGRAQAFMMFFEDVESGSADALGRATFDNRFMAASEAIQKAADALGLAPGRYVAYHRKAGFGAGGYAEVRKFEVRVKPQPNVEVTFG